MYIMIFILVLFCFFSISQNQLQQTYENYQNARIDTSNASGEHNVLEINRTGVECNRAPQVPKCEVSNQKTIPPG